MNIGLTQEWYHFWKCEKTHRLCCIETRDTEGKGTGKNKGTVYSDTSYDVVCRSQRGGASDEMHFVCNSWWMRICYTKHCKDNLVHVSYLGKERFREKQ